MSDLIDRDAFLKQERKWYCEECDRRKGVKNGRKCFVYEIGEAPCRSCELDDVLDDLEVFESASPRWVRCEKELPKEDGAYAVGWRYPNGCFYWGKVLFFNDKWQVDEEIPMPDYWMPIEPPREGE